ncbi:high frequency lysogenization protein HflD [Aliikangiella maris]|uniref:High frequency lysogenization protein HflD homolog n=2 Tax=Aliikangiella maris TaxID=3162458 RepID=A0ABV2BPS7_9GAMM
MSVNQQVIDQCIALAGIAQSVRIVQHLAWKGHTNDTDFKAVLASLLKVDAASAAGVFSGSFEVSSGLRILSQQIDPDNKDKDPEFVGMVISVMALQTQFAKNRSLMDKLAEKIQQLSEDYADQSIYQDEQQFERLINECSDIYKQTLSKLSQRIQVKGEPAYLKQPETQAKVRAALLAAIRACFLWRQSGGSRWHFIFKKKSLLAGLRQLLSNPIKE